MKKNICIVCNNVFDDSTRPEDIPELKSGHIIICQQCGMPYIVDKNMNFVELEKKEFSKLHISTRIEILGIMAQIVCKKKRFENNNITKNEN